MLLISLLLILLSSWCPQVTAVSAVLALVWNPGFCMKEQCNLPSIHTNQFTIHGLWINSCPIPPSRRSNSIKSVVSKSLKQRLDMNWPSSYGNNHVFWNHEWQSHGFCLGVLQNNKLSLSAQVHTYFNFVLNIHRDIAILSWLRDGNIFPSSTTSYTYQQIDNVIKAHTGHGSNLLCYRANSKIYLYEVEIEVDFDPQLLKYNHKPSRYNRRGLCPLTGIIISP